MFLLAQAALLPGCAVTEKVGGYFKGDDDAVEKPAPLAEFDPSVSVVRVWKKDAGVGADEQYLKLAPVVVNQRLYVIDSAGNLGAMDAVNGNRLWRKKIKAGESIDNRSGWLRGGSVRITGGPGYGEDSIIVGTEEGEIIALDAESGAEAWRAMVTSEVLSAPQKKENVVIVRSIDGKVFGLDGAKGRRLWVYDRAVPPLTLRGTSTPTIAEGVVIAGFDGGKMAALELRTGKLLWETGITTARGRSELERMVDIDAQPVVVDGVIYITTFQGHVAAVQLETGRILWSNDLSSYAGFSADEQYLYVADEDSRVLALDRFTGVAAWKRDSLRFRAVTAPAVVGEQVVLGDLEGYLHWLDKKSGAFSARERLCRSPIIVKPIVVGRMVYAYCSDGGLAAYTHR